MLQSKDGLLRMHFVLAKPMKPEHRGWLSYQLIFNRNREVEFLFQSTNDSPLFLDATTEPEVPTICTGIRTAVQDHGYFAYEPIDDRDFKLVVDAQNALAVVSIQFADVSVPANFRWSSGVEVTRTDLLHFVTLLEKQHADLADQ